MNRSDGQSDKVVVRYRDGSISKGFTGEFAPDKELFHVRLLSGDVVPVRMEKLKAVFFVKDFQGDREYIENDRGIDPWGGRRVEVHFEDGEIIRGYTLHYEASDHGFFMTPADSRSNNKSVFVLTAATRKITFL